MRLNAGCKLVFEATAPASLIVMLRPRNGPGQKVVREANEVKPETLTTDFVDINGNLCQRVLIAPGCFQIESSVTVETSDRIDIARGAAFVPVYELPEQALPILSTAMTPATLQHLL
jgi:hypothetical protein